MTTPADRRAAAIARFNGTTAAPAPNVEQVCDDAALLAWAAAQTWSTFAVDVARKGARFGLTEKQRAALQSMRAKCEAKAAPAPKADGVPGFGRLRELMDHIEASGNKYPRVRVQTPAGLDVIVTRSMQGRHAGRDKIFLGKSVNDPLLGFINADGTFEPSGAAKILPQGTKADVWELLKALRTDPANVFADHGKRLGFCVCCGRPLSDQVSVDRGIGPECIRKFGGLI